MTKSLIDIRLLWRLCGQAKIRDQAERDATW